LQLQSIRKNLNIPRYFQVCHGDNELLVDSCNLRSLDLLRDILFRDGKARLVEMLQDPGEGLLSEAGQHFAHEVVLPFRHIGQSSPAPGVNFLEPDQKINRSFVVGGQWLYVKIYVGIHGAERILMELIKPFLGNMVLSDMIEKWFFIRYQDPDPHLRLRFYHGARPDFWHQVLGNLTKFLAEMTETGVVSRLQTDTYNREIERYAGLSFDLVESIFHADSEAVLSILARSGSGPDPENQRWLAGLYGAGLLMGDFGLKPEDKVRLTEQLVTQFLEEFQAGKDLTTQLDKQYRQHRTLLWDSMENCLPGLSEIFSLRSSRICEVLHISAVDGLIPFTTIASFMHM
jgi:thiopeptide-type bacteriocin biosynthesis protein